MLIKNSEAYISRIEKIRAYQKQKDWSEKAILTRLENCLRAAEARKGKGWSAKRRASHVSRPKSIEQRQHLSKVMKGRKTSDGMLGKHHSEDTKNRMRQAQLGKPKYACCKKGYWYISPLGQEILFCPVIECAKLYGLQEEGLRLLRLGRLKKNKHKGWSYLREATESEIKNITTKKAENE